MPAYRDIGRQAERSIALTFGFDAGSVPVRASPLD
jgi:hypothetical protein